MRHRLRLLALLIAPQTFLVGPRLVSAQVPPDLARERSDFAEWLKSAAVSPLRAIAQQPIGARLTLGPAGSDVPLDGLPATQLIQERAGVAEKPQT